MFVRCRVEVKFCGGMSDRVLVILVASQTRQRQNAMPRKQAQENNKQQRPGRSVDVSKSDVSREQECHWQYLQCYYLDVQGCLDSSGADECEPDRASPAGASGRLNVSSTEIVAETRLACQPLVPRPSE